MTMGDGIVEQIDDELIEEMAVWETLGDEVGFRLFGNPIPR